MNKGGISARWHSAPPVHRRTASALRAATATSYQNDLTSLMQFLEEDSANMFSEAGMDTSRYDDNVDFKDPITNYSNIDGFKKNLKFLKAAFNPTYEMLDIKQTSEKDVTARWTMGFDVLPIKKSPLGKFWQPRMEFTGTTIYGTDDSGLIARHYDTWDSVQQQKFFSFEAFGDVLSQMFNFQRTPELEGPAFTLLKRKKLYTVREYQPFAVVEANMPAPGQASGVKQVQGGAFRELAGFLFGGNAEGQKMSMTTPVITSDTGAMQFVLPLASADDAPAPLPTSSVQVKTEPGGLYAAIRFPGRAEAQDCDSFKANLVELMKADGLIPGKGSLLLRYNDPGTKAPFRRNEILIPIESGFALWET